MGNFTFNNIEDLLFDHSFRQWALNPDYAENNFWATWMAQDARNAQLGQRCMAIIQTLNQNLQGLPMEAIELEISRISKRLTDQSEVEEKKQLFWRNPKIKWAVTMCTIAAVTLFVLKTPKQQENQKSYFSDRSHKELVQKQNGTLATQLITLPDGSMVHLERNSAIKYGTDVVGKERIIYLEGEAFFEVKRDPSRPFYVYTSNIVTRVLGTSFRVKAFTADKNALVMVKTGKVSVYKTKDFSDGLASINKLKGVVITPNQQIVFNEPINELNKSIIDEPQPLTLSAASAMEFNGTPISDVFEILKRVYGIAIVYDEDLMHGCSLSANMGNEPFYEKLGLICKAIDAEYEVIDGQIFISSGGCTHTSN